MQLKNTIAKVFEVLVSASITTIGCQMGGKIGETVIANIGISLGSNIIQSGMNYLKEVWLTDDNGIHNQDIQQALFRAMDKAMESLKNKYFKSDKALSLPSNEKEAICEFMHGLREYTKDNFSIILEKIIRPENINELKQIIVSESSEIAINKFCNQIRDMNGLNTYNDSFNDFFYQYFSSEVNLWFAEELKTDNKECNRAWRSFQWLLLEGIQNEVKNVKTNQEIITKDLEILCLIQSKLSSLSDIIESRIPDEPFHKNFDEIITQMQQATQDTKKISETTVRTEKKVDSISLKMDKIIELEEAKKTINTGKQKESIYNENEELIKNIMHINEDFEKNYLRYDMINNNIGNFIEKYYVERECDNKIKYISNSLFEMLKFLNNIDTMDIDADIKQNIISLIKKILMLTKHNFTLEPFNQLVNIFQNNKNIIDSDKILNFIEELSKNFNEIRNVSLLIGTNGSGKTLLALRQSIKYSWFISFNAITFKLNFKDFKDKIAEIFNNDLETFINKLTSINGSGLIIIDGIDEIDRFDDVDLINFINDINKKISFSVHVILTCRSIYIENQIKNWRNHDLNKKWIDSITSNANLININKSSEYISSKWIEKYCNCFEVIDNKILTTLSFISNRFTPRHIQHVFRVLASTDTTKIPETFIFSDIISLYSDYIFFDCHRRQLIETTKQNTYENIKNLSILYVCALNTSTVVTKKLLLTYQPEHNVFYNDVIEALILCNEIKIHNKRNEMEWSLIDIPYFMVSNDIFNKIEDIRSLNDTLEIIKKDYKNCACDILIHLFYHIYIAHYRNIVNKHEEIFDYENLSLSKFYEDFVAKLNTIGYEYVALCLFMEINNKKIEINTNLDFSEDAFAYISPDCACEFLFSLIEVFINECSNGKKELKWYVDKFIVFVEQLSKNYEQLDISLIEESTSKFSNNIFKNTMSKFIDNISLIHHLGNLPVPLQQLNYSIFEWSKRSIENIDNIIELDHILYHIGNTTYNSHTKYLAEILTDKIINNSKIYEWIVSDIEILNSRFYYVRQILINKFVDHNLILVKGYKIIDVYNKLNNGNKEQRRNAIFIIQRFFRNKVEMNEKLKKIIFKESDLELVSTALGILFNNQFNVISSFKNNSIQLLKSIVSNMVFKKKIVGSFINAIKGINNIDNYLKLLIKYRGIIETIDECTESFDQTFGSISKSEVSYETKMLTLNVIDNEKYMRCLHGIVKKCLN